MSVRQSNLIKLNQAQSNSVHTLGPQSGIFLFLFVFQKKRKTHKDITEEEVNKVPHSFVMHRGDVGKSVLQLEMDIRHVMEPYTATKLKVSVDYGGSSL